MIKHNPKYEYDCKNCKFNWCCGYSCACFFEKNGSPPGHVILEINKQRNKDKVSSYTKEGH